MKTARGPIGIIELGLLGAGVVAALVAITRPGRPAQIVEPGTRQASTNGAQGAILDIDDDGVEDVITLPTRASQRAGQSDVVVRSGATGEPLLTLASPNEDDLFGYAAAVGPDMNADGRPEILVGAPLAQVDGVASGVVYAFSTADGALIREWRGSEQSKYGKAVSTVGDLDGDGAADIAIGGFALDADGQPYGAVDIVSGASGAVVRSIYAEQVDDGFGHVVAPAGDWNGDGFDDMVAVAPLHLNLSGARGRAYLIGGRAPGAEPAVEPAEAAITIVDNPTLGVARFGRAVLPLIDTDDDGVLELAIVSSFAGAFGTTPLEVLAIAPGGGGRLINAAPLSASFDLDNSSIGPLVQEGAHGLAYRHDELMRSISYEGLVLPPPDPAAFAADTPTDQQFTPDDAVQAIAAIAEGVPAGDLNRDGSIDAADLDIAIRALTAPVAESGSLTPLGGGQETAPLTSLEGPTDPCDEGSPGFDEIDLDECDDLGGGTGGGTGGGGGPPPPPPPPPPGSESPTSDSDTGGCRSCGGGGGGSGDDSSVYVNRYIVAGNRAHEFRFYGSSVTVAGAEVVSQTTAFNQVSQQTQFDLVVSIGATPFTIEVAHNSNVFRYEYDVLSTSVTIDGIPIHQAGYDGVKNPLDRYARNGAVVFNNVDDDNGDGIRDNFWGQWEQFGPDVLDDDWRAITPGELFVNGVPDLGGGLTHIRSAMDTRATSLLWSTLPNPYLTTQTVTVRDDEEYYVQSSPFLIEDPALLQSGDILLAGRESASSRENFYFATFWISHHLDYDASVFPERRSLLDSDLQHELPLVMLPNMLGVFPGSSRPLALEVRAAFGGMTGEDLALLTLYGGTELVIADPTVAVFVVGSSTASTLDVATWHAIQEAGETVRLLGLLEGETTLTVSNILGEGAPAQPISIPIAVGGTMTFEYLNAPTFKTGYGTLEPPPPTILDEPEPLWLPYPSPIPTGAHAWIEQSPDSRSRLPSMLTNYINNAVALKGARVRLTLVDAHGRAMPSEAIRPVSRDGKVVFTDANGDPFEYAHTGPAGQQFIQIWSVDGNELLAKRPPALQWIPDDQWFADHDKVIIVIGHGAEPDPEAVEQAFIAPETIRELFDDDLHMPEEHRFNGHTVLFESHVPVTQAPEESHPLRRHVAMAASPMPLVNAVAETLLIQSLEITVLPGDDPSVYVNVGALEQLVVYDGKIGDSQATQYVVRPSVHLFRDAPINVVIDDIVQLHFDEVLAPAFAARGINATADFAPYDPKQVPQWWVNAVDDRLGERLVEGARFVTGFATVAEIAIALSPASAVVDLKDLGVELFNWTFTDEQPNEFVMAFAVVGLLGDSGFLTPATAAAGVGFNAVALVMKAVFRTLETLFPPEILKEMFRAGGTTLVDIGRAFANYAVLVFQSPIPIEEAATRLSQQAAYAVNGGIAALGAGSEGRVGNAVGATWVLLGRKTDRLLKDEAVVGLSTAVATYRGVPAYSAETSVDVVEAVIDRVRAAQPGAVADDSVQSIGEALQKTYTRGPDLVDGGGPRFLRADEALQAARRASYDPHLRDIVQAWLGPNRAIKSMEEFEALRRLPAEDLRPDQIDLMRQINLALIDVTNIPLGTPMAKAINISKADAMIIGGDATLGGFFTFADDIDDVSSSAQMVDRLRLDYHGSAFSGGEGYAVIRTPINDSVRSQTRIPRTAGYDPIDPSREVIRPEPAPFNGHGMPGSLDDRLAREVHSGGGVMDPDVTIIEFKNPDGTPWVRSFGGAGASDRWALRPFPGSPTGFVWEPLP